MASNKGLGKGLGALLGDFEEETRENSPYKLLPIYKVEPNRNQPRQDFDEEELEALAESLATHGILQPLTVRELDSGYYQIIAGERRWRAARMAGLTEVPAVIIEADDKKAMELALTMMTTLNKSARDAMVKYDVHACTDVTGFGLLGHSYEMASGSGVTIVLEGEKLPIMSGARDLASMGIIPAGAYRNMDYVGKHLRQTETAVQALVDLAADPQTSGGLLVALPLEDARQLLDALRPFAPWSAIVGRVIEQQDVSIIFE